MSTDDRAGADAGALPPDLGKLEGDYQVLTELHETADSSTYLARHLGLNRDVTITVVRPAEPGARENVLAQFAADARLLASMRHSNVIPVIEGRWLDSGAFAIVRARVRGSTLDQLLDAIGPMPAPRVAATLRAVHDGLGWARANGIAHRHVTTSAIVYQQGSGRILYSLDPPPEPANNLPNACDDARTIGRLASAMLSGVPDASSDREPLAALRPDLPGNVIAGVDALSHCDLAGPPPDVDAFITALESAPNSAPVGPAEVVTAAAGAASAQATADSGEAASRGPADVIVVKRGMSFGARLFTSIAVLVAIAVIGAMLFHHRAHSSGGPGAVIDTTQSAGDVTTRSQRADTAVIDTPGTPQVVAPPAIPAAPAPMPVRPDTSGAAVISPPGVDSTNVVPPAGPQTASPRGAVQPPSGGPPISPNQPRLHEPEHANTPPVRYPPGGSAEAAAGAPTNVCSSPIEADQARCLSSSIDPSDRVLGDAMQQVVIALRQRANATPGAPDPPAVTSLRTTQSAWLATRDATCAAVGTPPLYAQARAQCYLSQAAARIRQLRQMVAALPPAAPSPARPDSARRDSIARPDTVVRRDTSARPDTTTQPDTSRRRR